MIIEGGISSTPKPKISQEERVSIESHSGKMVKLGGESGHRGEGVRALVPERLAIGWNPKDMVHALFTLPYTLPFVE